MRNSTSNGWGIDGRRTRVRNDRELVVIKRYELCPEPAVGFSTSEAFLARFASRSELAALMGPARQKLEEAYSHSEGYISSLASLRRRAGLSQKELAEKLGTYQPNISMMESGQREPSFDMLYKLTDVLSVGFNELMAALRPGSINA